ncbi:Hypothetical protein YALI2_E01603g [Yarrowia lipolytica]|nr:Hypothetical protein YALI2_E01603g [Yarrowia lipolytica]
MLFSNLLLATVAAAGIVHLSLSARNLAKSPEASHHLAGRGIVHGTQEMGHTFYEAEVQVGTPPQTPTVIFDTGSGQVWLAGSNTTVFFYLEIQPPAPDPWGAEGHRGLDTFSYTGQAFEDFHIWVSTGTTGFELGIFDQAAIDNPKVNYVQALARSLGPLPETTILCWTLEEWALSTPAAPSRPFLRSLEDKSWSVACDSKPEITYQWGNTKIDVNLTHHIRKRPQGGCYLGYLTLAPDDQVTLLTGPAFISRAVVIYDNARDTITFGKAKFTDESDVVEITGDVPGAEIFKRGAVPSSSTLVGLRLECCL